jgi:hypothetical protein
MIKKFVNAWDENNGKLEEYIKTTNQYQYNSYDKLVRILFDKVINPYIKEQSEGYTDTFDIDRIHVIDDGDYQGTQLFIIPLDTYQPCSYDYVWTCHDYGSCSGCDLLMSISGYDDGIPSDKQVDDYMKLFLNLLQSCDYIKKI